MKTDTFIYMYICILLFEKLGNKQKNNPGFCFKNVSNVVNKNFISFSRFYKGNNSIFFNLQSENLSYFCCQYDEHVY